MTWVCDECYSAMEVTRVDRKTRVVHCPECGNEWLIDNEDEIINDPCSDDDMPECCAACGGPYPSCMTSCKIFDD